MCQHNQHSFFFRGCLLNHAIEQAWWYDNDWLQGQGLLRPMHRTSKPIAFYYIERCSYIPQWWKPTTSLQYKIEFLNSAHCCLTTEYIAILCVLFCILCNLHTFVSNLPQQPQFVTWKLYIGSSFLAG